MAASGPSAPPKTLGKYDILEEVGSGSMGSVYRARHQETQEIVAVKLMARDVARNTTYLKRFEQEFRVASKLDHPNIVRALEYDGSAAQPFLVMEFVDGESLGERLDRTDKMPEAEAIRIIVQAAEGLQLAHEKGLIHRDIKPDNIMVTKDGRVKLTDLGLVKEREATSDLTRPGIGLGTPNFMAPEQFKNAKNASVRCDVYSLGATLYQLVTGVLPFKGNDVIETMMRKMKNDLAPARTLEPGLSARTDAAIRRAMDADPQKRPATCREFVDDLTGEGAAPAEPPAEAREAPAPAAASPEPARRPAREPAEAPAPPDAEPAVDGRLVAVLAAVVAAAAAAVGYFLFQ